MKNLASITLTTHSAISLRDAGAAAVFLGDDIGGDL